MVSIKEAAAFLGVSSQTLRRWEREGKILPAERTPGGMRRYNLALLRPEKFHALDIKRKTIAYIRTSSFERKDDMKHQKRQIELYCAHQGWNFELIADFGSAMDLKREGLKQLLKRILAGDVGRLVITHRNRLLQFGSVELVFYICEEKNVEVVILNQGEDMILDEDLSEDLPF